MQTKSFLKSKINITNIIGFIVVMLSYLAGEKYIPAAVAGLIVFTLNVILQKFFSSQPIVETGIKAGWMMYLVNILGAVVMIAQYLLDNELFNIPPALLTMSIFILNLIIRTFFTNQRQLQ